MPYDVRKDHPYLVYDRFEFDVPVGSVGDNYDRFAGATREIRPVDADSRSGDETDSAGDVPSRRPASVCRRNAVYNTIESMIGHFRLVIDGIKVPGGVLVYRGWQWRGFYIVSDGSGRPYRCRPLPCFIIMQSLSKLIRGAGIMTSFQRSA